LIPIKPAALVVLLVASGCGVTPDSMPAQYAQPIHPGFARPAQAAPKSQPRPSRFADIAQAEFFAEVGTNAAAPLAPPPAPPVPEPKAVPLVPAPEETPNSIRACRPVRATIQQTQLAQPGMAPTDDYVSRPPVNDPRKLKKITEIQPYSNYEPDPLVRAEDPCRNLCPRPDGAPCDPLNGTPPACPDEVVLSNEEYIPRCFEENVFAWEASNIWYNPLYYEDVALERYGHTYPCFIQPFVSVGKFSVQLVGLPYQMGIDPPWKRIYPLGYYRPGEWAPKLHYQIPWNTRAALIQGGVTTGMIFLIP
jgi:hypothetical protein